MVLTDEQKQSVAAWIEEGAKPADVQARLEKEFDIRMTYMEVRFLIDDLKVMPKDPVPPPEPPKPAESESAEPSEPSPFEEPDLRRPAGRSR
jgi:transposase